MVSFRALAFDIVPIGAALGAGQSPLDPHGPVANAIAALSWLLFAGGAVVLLLVMALAAWASFAPPSKRAWLAREAAVVVGGIIIPAVVLSLLLIHTLTAIPASGAPDRAPLRIEVIGQQWWWRVRYVEAAGGSDFDTANEIRIPVGRPVELLLRSDDVIHSFWVPSLAGKLDMVPGRVNRLRIAADRQGVFRGQCAEYCGGPHAQMALYVVAEPPERFEQWLQMQRQPAAQGNELFLSNCAVCHTVRGTEASGTRGPDLTHVGSRLSLGAGILPNNAGTLARWIASSQHIKPGNLMPSMDGLRGEELGALAEYLQQLK